MPTKLQQTLVLDNSNFADLKGWAGDITAAAGTGTGIAAALFTLGFTKQTDTYTAKWDNGTTIGAGAIPTNAGNLLGAAFPTVANTARTALAGTHFKGAIANSTAYVVGDIVTDTTTAQIVFICTTGLTTGSPYTAPLSDTTHWSPYWMEIWKMAGSGGTSDAYIKLEYGGGATAANPALFIQLGTAYSANSGVLSGNVTLCEQCLTGTGTVGSGEFTWVGDGANYMGMMLERASGVNTGIFIMERAISGQQSNAPVYATTGQYVFFAKMYANGGTCASGALFYNTGVVPRFLNLLAPALIGATSYIANGLTPALPIFPPVGWLGNPVTVGIFASGSDTIEGASAQTTIYGATHTYLMTKTQAVYASPFGQTTPNAYGFGLRFE